MRNGSFITLNESNSVFATGCDFLAAPVNRRVGEMGVDLPSMSDRRFASYVNAFTAVHVQFSDFFLLSDVHDKISGIIYRASLW